MKTSVFRALIVSLVGSLIILVCLVCVYFFIADRLYRDLNMIEQADDIHLRIQRLHNSFLESEAELKNYLLTGDEEHRLHYNQVQVGVDSNLVMLLKDTNSFDLKRLVMAAEETYGNYKGLCMTKLKLYDSLRVYADADFAKLQDSSRVIFIQLKGILKTLDVENRHRLTEYHENKESNLRNTFIISLAFMLVAVVVSLLSLYYLLKYLKDRRRLIKQLKESNENKDKFFSIISHDLRGSVNAIQKLSEFLLSYNKDEAHLQQEIAEHIHSSSSKLSKLLDNMLTWARSQMGKMEVNIINFDLSMLVEETVSQHEDVSGQKDIIVESFVPKLTMVQADRNMIEVVLRNLIFNAIKFTDKGGEISITSREEDSKVVMTVSDNGIGMSDEQMAQLFKLEKLLSTRGTQNEFGTGLGLLLCKEFVARNKGEIRIESSLGKGTDVIVSLPMGT